MKRSRGDRIHRAGFTFGDDGRSCRGSRGACGLRWIHGGRGMEEVVGGGK